MAVVMDPLRRSERSKFIRVNNNYDNQDIVVENLLSQKHQWLDMPYTEQLSQNSWNLSSKTREDNYEDLIMHNPEPVGRIKKYKTPQRKSRYREPTPR